MPKRESQISRKTNETDIKLHIDLDPQPLLQSIQINTGIGFLDHMLHALAKHAKWNLTVDCKGDLDVDDHHTVEDVAIVLGTAFKQAIGIETDRINGIRRFGHAYAPLDEALSRCVVDISNRPHASVDLQLTRERIGPVLSTEMITHFLETFASSARITLHIDVLKGRNDHHK